MATEYNIANLFLEGFGLKVRDGYNIGIDKEPDAPKGLFKGIEIIDNEIEAFEKSALGTPILFPVYFLEGNYKQYNNLGEIIEKKTGTMRLPIASIVSFNREKIIGVTRINGNYGTVKEIYGFKNPWYRWIGSKRRYTKALTKAVFLVEQARRVDPKDII